MNTILEVFLGVVGVQVIVLLLLPWLPIVKSDKHLENGVTATNNVFWIAIDPTQPNLKGILSQELYESRYRSNFFNLFGYMVSTRVAREMELMGHAISIETLRYTVQPVERIIDEYRVVHARSLARYSQFSSVPRSRIVELLKEKEADARKWINENQSFIDKKYESLISQ